MRYGQILSADSANGIGIRVSLFVSGCTNHCPGCFQPETWDFNFGKPYTQETEDFILSECAKPYYDGMTILGGEPFELTNQEGLISLIREFRKRFPSKTIWMYSGFVYDKDLVPGGCRYGPYTDEILNSIDVLVDGRFILAERNISLRFKGSTNQRVIDMKATRQKGEVVLTPWND